MADLTLKQWTSGRQLQAVLTDTNGAINLTTASQVRLVMKGTTGQSPALITGTMTIASALGGYVTYPFANADLSIADNYNAEFAIFWAAGGLDVVPSNVYRQIVVMADLNGAGG